MTTDTERLRAVADEVERRLAARRKRPMADRLIIAGIWIASLPGITLLVLTGMSMLGTRVDELREDLNPLLVLSAIVGTIFFVGGLVVRASQGSHRKLRDDLRHLDFEALGRLAAQLQEIEITIPALRAQQELDRGVMLRRMNEIESQRQSDYSMVIKLVDGVHEHIDRSRADTHDDLDHLCNNQVELAKMISGVRVLIADQRMSGAEPTTRRSLPSQVNGLGGPPGVAGEFATYLQALDDLRRDQGEEP